MVFAISRTTIRRTLALLVSFGMLSATSPAAADKLLTSVRGNVGFQTAADGPFTRVAGKIVLPDDQYAVTQRASNALLQLPDSSEVAIGADTIVQVGAFNEATSPTPTTLALRGGALRFNVRHPEGARANYVFRTPTSTTAVRGTLGLIATGPAGDQISCLSCDADDVVVTVGAQTFRVLTGQTLTIRVGVVVVVATTISLLGVFSAAGLATTTSTVTAFAAGVSAGANAGATAGAAAATHGAATGLLIGGAAAVGGIAAAAGGGGGGGSAAAPVPSATPYAGSATLTGLPRPAVTPSRVPTR